MTYLNPHQLDFTGGVAKLKTSNPMAQLQTQALAEQAFELVSQAMPKTTGRQDLTIGSPEEQFTSAKPDFTYGRPHGHVNHDSPT